MENRQKIHDLMDDAINCGTSFIIHDLEAMEEMLDGICNNVGGWNFTNKNTRNTWENYIWTLRAIRETTISRARNLEEKLCEISTMLDVDGSGEEKKDAAAETEGLSPS